jgi:hypothetical protein
VTEVYYIHYEVNSTELGKKSVPNLMLDLLCAPNQKYASNKSTASSLPDSGCVVTDIADLQQVSII